MNELLDIYNSRKERTGKIVERKYDGYLNPEEYIISVTCWITNLEGKILLTKRKLDKRNGGKWEPTAGLVKTGETSIQAIIRELNEEIGLSIKPEELKYIQEIIEKRPDISFFRDIYLIKKDIKIEDLRFKDGEVISAKYVSIEELIEMIDNNESFEYLRYFIDIYNNEIKN